MRVSEIRVKQIRVNQGLGVPLIFLSLDLNDFDALSFLHKGLGQSDMDLCQFYDLLNFQQSIYLMLLSYL